MLCTDRSMEVVNKASKLTKARRANRTLCQWSRWNEVEGSGDLHKVKKESKAMMRTRCDDSDAFGEVVDQKCEVACGKNNHC